MPARVTVAGRRAALLALAALALAAPTTAGAGHVAEVLPSVRHAASTRSLPSSVLTTDWSLQVVPWRYLRMNGLPLLGRRTRAPADARGIPLQRWRDGSLIYNPTVLAEYALRRVDGWKRTGRSFQIRRALAVVDKLDSMAIVRGDLRWQPHRYDHDAQGLDAPWVNANSQGLTLSLYSRLYQLTGKPRYLQAADALFRAYLRLETPTSVRWFATVYPDGHLWLEHYPGGVQLGVLNAHLNAAFGLYDYWRVSGSTEAVEAFRAALTTVRDDFDQFRRPGRLSAYSLVGAHYSLGYHRTHRAQLRLAAHMTGDPAFARMARLLWEDEQAWLSR